MGIPTAYIQVPTDEIFELNGTRSENYSATEFTAHVEYICPWSNRYSFIRHIASNTIYNSPIAYFNHYYPAYVTSVQCAPYAAEGVKTSSYNNSALSFQPYTKAKLSVDYKGISRAGDTSLQQTVTPDIQHRQLPTFNYYWQSSGNPVIAQEAPGFLEGKLTFQRQLRGVRVIPSWFLSLASCVNSNSWADGNTGVLFAPGTMLYMPTGMDRQITSRPDDDDRIWNLSYEITWNPIGWNNFYTMTGVVDQMMRYDTNEPFYPYKYSIFPPLILNPDATAYNELFGDFYSVELVDGHGKPYIITVAPDGGIV